MADDPTTPEAGPDPAAAEILSELEWIRRTLDGLEERIEECRARRTELFMAGQACSPKITQLQLAEASGISSVAVSKTLTRAAAAGSTDAG